MPKGQSAPVDTAAIIEALWQIAKSPDISVAELRSFRQSILEIDAQLWQRLLTSQMPSSR